jgi:hypothetical protein
MVRVGEAWAEGAARSRSARTAVRAEGLVGIILEGILSAHSGAVSPWPSHLALGVEVKRDIAQDGVHVLTIGVPRWPACDEVIEIG